MSTKGSRLMVEGLIDRPGSQTLIYAYLAKITVSGWQVVAQQDSSSLTRLVELAIISENQRYRDGLSVRLENYSHASITPSILGQGHFLASLPIHVHIEASDQLVSSAPTLAKRSMLVLARVIDLQGSIATTHRTRALTFCAWNTFLGGGWQEPPPGSIVNKKSTRTFLRDWEIRGAGLTKTGLRGPELMKGSSLRQ